MKLLDYVRYDRARREFLSCGHQIGSPVNATTSAKPADETERRHIHGLVYDFVDINSRVPKEHRKWKDEGADG